MSPNAWMNAYWAPDHPMADGWEYQPYDMNGPCPRCLVDRERLSHLTIEAGGAGSYSEPVVNAYEPVNRLVLRRQD
eukprot:2035832-Rhodomonas_salina.1